MQKSVADPRQLVKVLAKAKALFVFDLRSNIADRMVIGSDQILVLHRANGPMIFGKPKTALKACQQLKICSGQEVSLVTGVHIEGSATNRNPAFRKTWVHLVRMQYRNLSAREIKDYVVHDQPLECAGSFKFEERGISLFSKVISNDPTSIEGLPLLSLHKVLLASGRRFSRSSREFCSRRREEASFRALFWGLFWASFRAVGHKHQDNRIWR